MLQRLKNILALSVMVLGWTATEAGAIPRYSVRYRQDCNLCHQNPAGGGQRSAYAVQYLIPSELVIFPWSEEELEKIDPQLGRNVSVGADIRTQHMTSIEGSGLENFFQMQGDVYLSLSIDERNLLYFEQGIRESYDLYGLSYTLPLDGHVKVGRFTPSYGWRFADHTRYVREKLGFAPPAHTDVGVELGFAPGETTLNLALMNGAAGSRLDTDDKPAAFGRASQRLAFGPLGLTAGASFFFNDTGDARRVGGGPFGAVHWGRLTWLGELDATQIEVDGSPTLTELATTQELAVQVQPGLDLVGVYDFYDPDLDLLTGKESGFSLGIELLPQPYLQLQALVRGWDTSSDHTQAIIQAHFLY